jgi:hypothetical protein
MDQDEFDLRLAAMEGTEKFLFAVANGVGPINAGYECDWTPAVTRSKLKDPEFAILVKDAMEMRAEKFEQALYKRALAGNVPALQLVLMSQYADRGWKPPATKITHEVGGKVDVNIVASVREAVKERISAGHVAELQGPIEEAEVVDP